jgi:N-acyl-L-homoserine lactone synthetase
VIHVVSIANQHLYAAQLDQMFRMRHAFYVEGHQWSGLISRDGREVDEFDNEAAVYLLSLDPWGEVAASVRLNPATGPTLLKKFADYSDEPLPASDDCWDISRWIAAQVHRRGANPRWPTNHQRELMLGLLEFGLSRGLTRFSMLAELRLAERIKAYGWPIRFLGAARPYEGGKGVAVAAEIRTGYDVLALTRGRTGLVSPVLFEANSESPSPAGAPPVGPDLEAIIGDIGVPAFRRVLSALAAQIANVHGADTPQRIELAVALHRLAERVGADLSPPEPEVPAKSEANARLEGVRKGMEGTPPGAS